MCASRKSRRWSRSATTIAKRPSGVKYMLYGSSTGIGFPGLPVCGSIGVTLFPTSFSTYRVFRSYEGVTCCGRLPTAKCSTTLRVAGSITSTVLLWLFGT